MIFQIIFELFLYFCEALIFLNYARALFKPKYGTSITVAGVFCGYILLFFGYKLNSGLLNFFMIFIINALLFAVLYSCKIKTALTNSVFLLFIMLFGEFFMISLISVVLKADFSAFRENFGILVANMTLSKLSYYLLSLFLIRFLSKKGTILKSGKMFWLLMVVPLTSISVMMTFTFIEMYASDSKLLLTICSLLSILILISNIIAFFIYEQFSKNANELIELKSEKQQQETDSAYFKILEKNNEELQILTHDIKNHLFQISNMADSEEVTKYIDSLYGTISKYGHAGTSGNKTLDIIINKYTTLCDDQNVDISFENKSANLAFVNSIDLATIFNNLLDNALEASAKSQDKKITVRIYSKNANVEVVHIKNSCAYPPIVKNGVFVTTKEDKRLHGLGIKSVIKILEKYEAIYDWSYDRETMTFETMIVFPNPKIISIN